MTPAVPGVSRCRSDTPKPPAVSLPSAAEQAPHAGGHAVDLVESKGGRFIWSGRVDSQVIGEGGEQFHMVALVEYPSRAAFIEMVSSPAYLAAHADREAGLERTIVVACSPAQS